MKTGKLLFILGGVLIMARCVRNFIPSTHVTLGLALTFVYALGLALASLGFIFDYADSRRKGMLVAGIIGLVAVLLKVCRSLFFMNFDASVISTNMVIAVTLFGLFLPAFMLLVLPAMAITNCRDEKRVVMAGWTCIAIWAINFLTTCFWNLFRPTMTHIMLNDSIRMSSMIISIMDTFVLGIMFIFMGLRNRKAE